MMGYGSSARKWKQYRLRYWEQMYIFLVFCRFDLCKWLSILFSVALVHLFQLILVQKKRNAYYSTYRHSRRRHTPSTKLTSTHNNGTRWEIRNSIALQQPCPSAYSINTATKCSTAYLFQEQESKRHGG